MLTARFKITGFGVAPRLEQAAIKKTVWTTEAVDELLDVMFKAVDADHARLSAEIERGVRLSLSARNRCATTDWLPVPPAVAEEIGWVLTPSRDFPVRRLADRREAGPSSPQTTHADQMGSVLPFHSRASSTGK